MQEWVSSSCLEFVGHTRYSGKEKEQGSEERIRGEAKGRESNDEKKQENNSRRREVAKSMDNSQHTVGQGKGRTQLRKSLGINW